MILQKAQPGFSDCAFSCFNFTAKLCRYTANHSLGLPNDLTPHSARHTFGTRMSAAGARPEDIQKIMGHADYSMTANVYVDQDESALKSAIEKMA